MRYSFRAGKSELTGRIYTQDCLNKMFEEISKHGQLLGELGYGESATISLANVSHKVSDPVIDNDILSFEITILDTKPGVLLASVLNECQFRPRGFGTVNEDGTIQDYNFITFDAITMSN